MALPFLDTRLHYSYDNADFSFKARCGNRNGDLRSQFGVTMNGYSRWAQPAGPPAYYTDHPLLVKTLFQQFTKIVGTPEWASRTFYLAVSFAIAAGLYVIVLLATGSLLAALAGAVVLVSLPLFAVYQTSVKFETDGMLAGVWLFAFLAAYLRKGSRRALVTYGTLVGAAFLVHWTAMLFVGAMIAYLWIRRREATARGALRVTVGASALGLAALLGLMSYLQGGWGAARGVLVSAFVKRSSSIPASLWWPRQWIYLEKNFSRELCWLALALSIFLAHRRWSSRDRGGKAGAPRPAGDLLGVFCVSTISVSCVWLLAFRQGSFIHVYWQYWFCLSIAALVAAVVAELPPRGFGRLVGVAGSGALVVFLLARAEAAYGGVLRDQMGTPSDIAFLSSLRDDRFDRFVFVPVSDASLNQWFQGPLFEYYTDRPVVTAAQPEEVRVGDKVLVLRYRQREQVVDGVSRWSKKPLVHEKCGSRMCAYDVKPWRSMLRQEAAPIDAARSS